MDNNYSILEKIEGTKNEFEDFMKFIGKEGDLKEIGKVVKSLLKTDKSRFKPILIKLLKHKNPIVRYHILWNLGHVGEKEDIEEIIKCLDDPHPKVRRTSIYALKRLKAYTAVEEIIPLLKDKDEKVRIEAGIALGYLGEPIAFSTLINGIDKIKPSPNQFQEIIKALGLLGDKRAVPYLIQSLRKGRNNIKKASIESLSLIGDKSAVPIIKDYLKDEDWSLRVWAAAGLGYFKLKAGHKILVEALKDTDNINSKIALRSLGALAEKIGINEIIDSLKDNRTSIKLIALNLLLDICRQELQFISKIIEPTYWNKVRNNDFPITDIIVTIDKMRKSKNRIDNVTKVNLDYVCSLMALIGYEVKRSYIEEKINSMMESNRKSPYRTLSQFIEENSQEEIKIEDMEDTIFDTDAVRVRYNSRPKQKIFREKAIRRYGAFCAVCGLKVVELLEAAHIISKKDKGSDDPRNAIILCCLHHKAFDSGLFAIEPSTLAIHYNPKGPKSLDLKIKYDDIKYLDKKPHLVVLEWRWGKWISFIDSLV